MFRKTDFTQLDGIDWSQDLADFLQGMTEHLSRSIAALMGDKAVLRGVVNTNGTVSNGIVVYGDEVLPLIGGSAATHVDVDEMDSTELFGDGNQRPVSKTRVLRLVSISTTTSFPFTDLVRPGQIKTLWESGDTKTVKCDLAYVQANFDLTTWEALPNSSRAGWKVDLDAGGRVIMGWHPSSTDPGSDPAWSVNANTLQWKGGEQLHKLTIAEMPAHSHQQRWTSGSNGADGSRGNLNDGNQATSSVGGDQGHNNIQPSIVYLKLVKI